MCSVIAIQSSVPVSCARSLGELRKQPTRAPPRATRAGSAAQRSQKLTEKYLYNIYTPYLLIFCNIYTPYLLIFYNIFTPYLLTLYSISTHFI